MPANLPPDSKLKWLKASQTRDPEEKVEALQEFLASIPKHKGNEKLRKQVKKKIANLRLQFRKKNVKKKSVGKRIIPKEGAARILILGQANSGKSSFLKALTNANPTVAPYPYTTVNPIPGIMQYKDIRMQLIEIPSTPKLTTTAQSKSLICSSDAFILLLDLSMNLSDQLQYLFNMLNYLGVSPKPLHSKIEFQQRGPQPVHIHVSGRLLDCTIDDICQLLNIHDIKRGLIKTHGDVTLQDVKKAILEDSKSYRPILVIGNKVDIAQHHEKTPLHHRLKEVDLLISCKTRKNLEKIPGEIFKILNIIRVYTKHPRKKAQINEPFILKKGSTIKDLAERIHSTLLFNFKYAKVWGPSAQFAGEKVGKTHILQDGDNVEIHIS